MTSGGLLALLLILAYFPGVASAVTFWEETFENGDLSVNWIGSCGFGPGGMGTNGLGCNATVTTNQAHDGTHSMEGIYNGPRPGQPAGNPTCGLPQDDPPNCQALGNCAPGCGAFYDRTHPVTNEIWYRFWMRFNNWTPGRDGSKIGFDFGATGSEPVWYSGGITANNQLWIQLATTNFYTCPNGSVDRTCNYLPNAATIPLNNDTWYCIETHVVSDSPYGSGTGLIEGFVNSTQTLSYPNRHVNDGPNGYPLARIPYTQYGFGTRWLDSIAVGDTRIGCGGAQPAPGTPSLTVTYLRRVWHWILPSWALAATR